MDRGVAGTFVACSLVFAGGSIDVWRSLFAAATKIPEEAELGLDRFLPAPERRGEELEASSSLGVPKDPKY